MMAYSTIMVILVVSILASILLYYHNKHVWEEFNLRTASLSAALSHDLELLVLLENKKAIERMLEGVLKVQDVVSVSVFIFNENRELLVRSGDPSSISSEYRKNVRLAIEIESDEIIEELMEPAKEKGLEKIGSVEIMFSTHRIKNDMMKMVFLVLFFMVIIIVLRIISDYFFTKGIIKPIGKLVKGSEGVANGDLSQRIDIGRSDEIGKLASSFNAMVRSLKERNDEIMDHHQKIDASLKEKELLLREIHHRVKNNMQLISSMLRLQSKYISDKKDIEIFEDCRARIKSMALIHEKLYKSKDLSHIDFKLYIRDLAKELYRSYVVDKSIIELNIDVENVFLGIDTAIPCGLIINELISNSLKHAFPEGIKGEISITFRLVDNYDLELIVSDNGIGLPKDLNLQNTGSLGLELVNTLANQVDGELEVNRTGGTRFKIKFKELKYRKRI